MRVLYEVIQHLKPGGIEKLVVDILKYKQENIAVFLVVLEPYEGVLETAWPELAELKHAVIFLNKKTGFDLNAIRHFRKILVRHNRNNSHNHSVAIHTHHIGPLLYGGLASLGLPFVTHVHTEHDAWHLKDKKQLRYTKFFLKIKKIRLVADAKLVRVEFQHLIPSAKSITVIHNGINTNKFKERSLPLAENRTFTYGCAARLVKEKNLDTLIRAFSNLPISLLSNSRLIIAGEGEEKSKLQHLVQDLDLQDKVLFAGYLDHVEEFYVQIDAFTLSSTFEGLPLSLLEAQACNVPVVASDVGAVSEAVCEQTGILVAENTIESWTLALIKVRSVNTLNIPRDFILKRFKLSDMIHNYNKLLWSE